MLHLIQNDTIHDNERKIAALLRGFFRKETLAGGIGAYMQGQTATVLEEDEDKKTVYAEIVEDALFQVRLSLAYLPYSSCTCAGASGGSCRHMLLLLLLILEDRGLDIERFVRDNGLYMGMAAAKPKKRDEPAIKPSSPGAASPPSPPSKAKLPQTDFQQWPGILQRLLPLENFFLNERAAELKKRIEGTLLSFPNKWPDRDLAAIFQILALLHALKAIAYSFTRSFARQHVYVEMADYYVRHTLEKCTQLALRGPRIPQDYAKPLASIAALLREYAFQFPYSPVNWMTIYRMLWSSILNQPAMRDKEKAVLLRMSARSYVDPEIGHMRLAAAAHHVWVEEGDEAAMRFVDDKSGHPAEERRPHLYFDYLEMSLQTGEWDKLLMWARWMLPGMGGASQGNVRYFFDTWKKAADATGKQQEWEEAVVKLLPHSIAYYGELLIRRKAYRTWMEVHLVLNLDPEECDPDGLKKVAAAAPEVLLPYYHQCALLWIEEKNREGYQEAVLHLQELKRLYKKMNRVEEWDYFMERLELRYARLRALREELRRGGLIS